MLDYVKPFVHSVKRPIPDMSSFRMAQDGPLRDKAQWLVPIELGLHNIGEMKNGW